MIAHPGQSLAALAIAALVLPGSASAGSTATRCNALGCAHIHCNSTGDRCYRYEDDTAHGERKDCAGCGGTFATAQGASRRLCDSDGDRCYVSRARRWNYREYYRRHGHRWDN